MRRNFNPNAGGYDPYRLYINPYVKPVIAGVGTASKPAPEFRPGFGWVDPRKDLYARMTQATSGGAVPWVPDNDPGYQAWLRQQQGGNTPSPIPQRPVLTGTPDVGIYPPQVSTPGNQQPGIGDFEQKQIDAIKQRNQRVAIAPMPNVPVPSSAPPPIIPSTQTIPSSATPVISSAQTPTTGTPPWSYRGQEDMYWDSRGQRKLNVPSQSTIESMSGEMRSMYDERGAPLAGTNFTTNIQRALERGNEGWLKSLMDSFWDIKRQYQAWKAARTNDATRSAEQKRILAAHGAFPYLGQSQVATVDSSMVDEALARTIRKIREAYAATGRTGSQEEMAQIADAERAAGRARQGQNWRNAYSYFGS